MKYLLSKFIFISLTIITITSCGQSDSFLKELCESYIKMEPVNAELVGGYYLKGKNYSPELMIRNAEIMLNKRSVIYGIYDVSMVNTTTDQSRTFNQCALGLHKFIVILRNRETRISTEQKKYKLTDDLSYFCSPEELEYEIGKEYTKSEYRPDRASPLPKKADDTYKGTRVWLHTENFFIKDGEKTKVIRQEFFVEYENHGLRAAGVATNYCTPGRIYVLEDFFKPNPR